MGSRTHKSKLDIFFFRSRIWNHFFLYPTIREWIRWHMNIEQMSPELVSLFGEAFFPEGGSCEKWRRNEVFSLAKRKLHFFYSVRRCWRRLSRRRQKANEPLVISMTIEPTEKIIRNGITVIRESTSKYCRNRTSNRTRKRCLRFSTILHQTRKWKIL